GAHRDLHSFPTRRSSDLPVPAHCIVVGMAGDGVLRSGARSGGPHRRPEIPPSRFTGEGMAAGVILSAVRTPIGVFRGALASLSAHALGARAIAAAIERAGLTPEEIKQVNMGW